MEGFQKFVSIVVRRRVWESITVISMVGRKEGGLDVGKEMGGKGRGREREFKYMTKLPDFFPS